MTRLGDVVSLYGDIAVCKPATKEDPAGLGSRDLGARFPLVFRGEESLSLVNLLLGWLGDGDRDDATSSEIVGEIETIRCARQVGSPGDRFLDIAAADRKHPPECVS